MGGKNQKAVEDIRWLLEKADGVAEKRNDAIHAPCSLGIVGHELEIIPIDFYGNARAKHLRGQDILSEFDWYEKGADTLLLFTREIESVLMEPTPGPWPSRPQMPTLAAPPP